VTIGRSCSRYVRERAPVAGRIQSALYVSQQVGSGQANDIKIEGVNEVVLVKERFTCAGHLPPLRTRDRSISRRPKILWTLLIEPSVFHAERYVKYHVDYDAFTLCPCPTYIGRNQLMTHLTISTISKEALKIESNMSFWPSVNDPIFETF
jgi:hypothetical protein